MTPGLQNKTVAVFGGTGFIGSYLVRRLHTYGARVICVSRGRRTGSQKLPAETAYADLLDRSSLEIFFENYHPEIVYHLAGDPDKSESFHQMSTCAQGIIQGTINLLQTAEKRTQLLVYGDTTKVYGNSTVPFSGKDAVQPNSSYAIAKAAAWQYCQLASQVSSMNVASIRPTFVYGDGQNFNLISYIKRCVDKNEPIILQGGQQTRDLLYIEDAIEAFIRVAVSPEAWGHSIVIGSGEERTVLSICQEVLSILKSNLLIECRDEAARLTEIWRMCADIREAQKLLCWSPQTSLSEGLTKALGVETNVNSRAAVA